MGLTKIRIHKLQFKQYKQACFSLSEALRYILDPPKSFRNKTYVLMPHFGPADQLKEVTFSVESLYKGQDQEYLAIDPCLSMELPG